jgi:hypothetical protein
MPLPNLVLPWAAIMKNKKLDQIQKIITTNKMKTEIRISKLLQIGLLLTLFLPFFPSGCESKKAEEASVQDTAIVANDSLSTDSVKQAARKLDADTVATTTTENSIQKSDTTKKESEDSNLSTKISKKSSILRLLLRPNDNYTGIASLINCFSFLQFGYGLGMAFILWVIALIVKLKDFNNIFILMNIIGLILMFYSYSISNILNDERLWGFWVCIFWSAIMIIYDCILLIRLRRAGKFLQI